MTSPGKKRALPVVLSSQTVLNNEDDATVTFSTEVQSLIDAPHLSTTSSCSSALTDIYIDGSKYWQVLANDRLFLIASPGRKRLLDLPLHLHKQ